MIFKVYWSLIIWSFCQHGFIKKVKVDYSPLLIICADLVRKVCLYLYHTILKYHRLFRVSGERERFLARNFVRPSFACDILKLKYKYKHTFEKTKAHSLYVSELSYISILLIWCFYTLYVCLWMWNQRQQIVWCDKFNDEASNWSPKLKPKPK